jgi:hypothetical protein
METLKERLIASGYSSKDVASQMGKSAQEIGKMFKDDESQMDKELVAICYRLLESKQKTEEKEMEFKVIAEKFMPEKTDIGFKVKLNAVVGADGVVCNRIHMSNFTYGLLTGVMYDSVVTSAKSIPLVRKLLVKNNTGHINVHPVCDKHEATGQLLIWVSPARDWDATRITDKQFVAEIVVVNGN